MENLLMSLSQEISSNAALGPVLALVAGIITSVTPCALSTVPLIIGFIGGGGEKNVKKSFIYSLSFAVGLTVTFTMFAVISAVAGSFFGNYSKVWLYLLGGLMLMMGLQTLGIFTFIKSKNLTGLNKKRGIIGGFILGILSGVFSSPCSTPVLIVLLGIIGSKGSLTYGIVLMLCYSLGYSALTIIAGTSVGFVQYLKTSKHYGSVANVLNYIMAALMFIMGFYMIYVA